jgi:hypothetical protein
MKMTGGQAEKDTFSEKGKNDRGNTLSRGKKMEHKGHRGTRKNN